MFDINYALLILDIFLMILSMLILLKPIFGIIGMGLSGILIWLIIQNITEMSIITITITCVILNLGCFMIGLSRNKRM